MTRSPVIINSDDFGETTEITRGILEGIDAGVVTSTTILANMPGTDLAIAEAARRGREVSFGVHLNLCEGRPLTASRSLVRRDGTFHPKRRQALRALSGRLDLDEVASEIEAQISRIASGGVQVSHLDAHKHLHQLPGVDRVVADVARRLGIERVRCTLEEGLRARGLGLTAWTQRAVRRSMARRAARNFSRAGLRYPERVFDVVELMRLPDRSARIALLERPGRLTEMVCHCGTARADQEKPGSCSRHEELRFLLSDDFRSLLDQASVELKTFWDR